MTVALRPDHGIYRQILGAALYRAGRFAEAAAELESNIPRNPESAGLDWLFLTMSRQRMGNPAAARAALAEAVRWRAAMRTIGRDQDASFQAVLREAESLLAGTRLDLPADVFGR